MTRGVIYPARLGPEDIHAAVHRELDVDANARAPSIYRLWLTELSITRCPHTAELSLHTIQVFGASN